MIILKKCFLTSIVLTSMFNFSSCKACNVVDIYRDHPKIYQIGEEKLDGVIMSPIKKIFDINSLSSISANFLEFDLDEKVYEMEIKSDSKNVCYYTLKTDDNIPDKLLRQNQIIINLDTPSFVLLKTFFLLCQEYDRLDKEESYNIFEEYPYQGQEEYGDLLASKKQHLYNSMLLCINKLLNNLSEIY